MLDKKVGIAADWGVHRLIATRVPWCMRMEFVRWRRWIVEGGIIGVVNMGNYGEGKWKEKVEGKEILEDMGI